MKIYFAGAIRGKRDQIDVFKLIVKTLKELGHTVLTEHVANINVIEEEKNNSCETIFQRDYDWLSEADIVVAEVSGHSTGVGMEIGFALEMDKKVYALYKLDIEESVSKMVLGCEDIVKIPYTDEVDLVRQLNDYFK